MPFSSPKGAKYEKKGHSDGVVACFGVVLREMNETTAARVLIEGMKSYLIGPALG